MGLNNHGSLPEDITEVVLKTGDRYKIIYDDLRYFSDFEASINEMSNEKGKYITLKALEIYKTSKGYEINYTAYPYLIKTMFLVLSLYLKKQDIIGSNGNEYSSEIINYETQLEVHFENNNYEIMTDINSLALVLNRHFFTLSTDCQKACEEKTKLSDSIVEKANAIYADRGVQDFSGEYEIIRKKESKAKSVWLFLSLALLTVAGIIFYQYILPLGMLTFSKDFSYAEHLFVFLIRISYVAVSSSKCNTQSLGIGVF